MIEPEYVYEVKPVGSQENHTQDINNSSMFLGDLPDSNLNDKIGDETFIVPADSDFDPKIGNCIEFVIKDSTDKITSKIVGKVNGKYRRSYNVQRDHDGEIRWLDLERNV